MGRTKNSKNTSIQCKIAHIYEFVKEHGRAPVSTEIDPYIKTFLTKQYGSYDQGLIHFGIDPLTKEEKTAIRSKKTEAKWKLRIIEYYNKYGKSPTVRDLKKEYSAYPPSYMCSNYSKILKSLEMEVNRECINYKYTKEDCINLYLDLCNRLGYTANANDINEDEKLPSFAVLIKDFNSLRNLQIAAGVEITSEEYHKYTRDCIADDIRKCYEEIGENIYIQKEFLNYFKSNAGESYSIKTIKRYFPEHEEYKDIIKAIIEK